MICHMFSLQLFEYCGFEASAIYQFFVDALEAPLIMSNGYKVLF